LAGEHGVSKSLKFTIFLAQLFAIGTVELWAGASDLTISNRWSSSILEYQTIPLHVVDTNTGPLRIHAADMDGDQDLDIVGASSPEGVLVWENLGTASGWAQHTIDPTFTGTRWVIAADFDGDQDLDIVGTADGLENIVWWENTGITNQWQKRVVSTNFPDAFEVCAGDMDGNGDVDILATSRESNAIRWWQNTNQGSNWIVHSIVENLDEARSGQLVDLDGDLDLDVIGISYAGRRPEGRAIGVPTSSQIFSRAAHMQRLMT
jgi:hypothetical protein